MKNTYVALQVGVLAVLSFSLLGLMGCSGETAKSSAAETTSFNGNPNTPEAKAAVANARATDAAKAAQSRAAAQSAGQAAPK